MFAIFFFFVDKTTMLPVVYSNDINQYVVTSTLSLYICGKQKFTSIWLEAQNITEDFWVQFNTK